MMVNAYMEIDPPLWESNIFIATNTRSELQICGVSWSFPIRSPLLGS